MRVSAASNPAVVTFHHSLVLMHPFPGKLSNAVVNPPRSVGPRTTKAVGISMLAHK